MIRASEPAIMWLWIDDATGMCFPETMYSTEAYALQQAERILGKRRMSGMGEMRAVRVTIEPLTAEETAAHRAEYEAWKAQKDLRARTPRAAAALAAQDKGGV